jgi:hypothetical protein
MRCIPDSLGSLTRSLCYARRALASQLSIIAGGSSRRHLLHRVVELIVLRIGCCRHDCEGSANVYIYTSIPTNRVCFDAEGSERRDRLGDKSLRVDCAKGRNQEDWTKTLLRSAGRVYIERCLTEKATGLGETGRMNPW